MARQPHFAVLDGLRGIAALTVLVFHVMQSHHSGLPQAALAVDFFFLLSGFVVAYAYEAKLRTTLNLEAFMRIRLTRLYPLIFLGTSVGITLTVLHFIALDDITASQVIVGAIFGLLLLPCIVYPQWDTAYPMNLPAWSLFFEIVINFAYALIARYLSTPRLILLTAAAAAILIYISLSTGGLQPIGARKLDFELGFGRVLFPFAAGVVLYRFRRPSQHAPYLGCLLPISLAALLFAPVRQSPVVDLIYVIALFPVIVGLGSNLTVGPKMSRIFFFAGQMSYPVYITHQPFLRVFSQIESHAHLNGQLLFPLEVIICLVIAYAAMRFFDEPLRAMLNKSNQTSLFAPRAGEIAAQPPPRQNPGLPTPIDT